jgi:hypothetical protein
MVGITPAATMFRTIRQRYQIFAIINGTEFANALGAYDPGPVNPKKLRGIQLFFERVHRFADQMRTSAPVELRIVSGRRDPFDLVNKDNANP